MLIMLSVTKPLAITVDLVTRFADGNSLNQRVTVSSRDELGQMLIGLKRMQESMKKR